MMAKKYPYISAQKDMRKKWNHTVLCEVCAKQASSKVEIQTSWFRGEDVYVKACEEHKNDAVELAKIGIAKEQS